MSQATQLRDDRVLILTNEGKHRKQMSAGLKAEGLTVRFVDSTQEVTPCLAEWLPRLFVHDWSCTDPTQCRQLQLSLARLEEFANLIRVGIVEHIDETSTAQANDYGVQSLILRSSGERQFLSRVKRALFAAKNASPATTALAEIRQAMRKNYSQDEIDQQIQRAVSRFPHHAGVQIEFGHLCVRQERFIQAHSIANELLRSDPNNVRAMNLRSRAFLKEGDYERAEETLMGADRLSPDHPDRLVLLGEAFFGKDDLEMARKFFNKAATVDPGHPEAIKGESKVALSEGDFDAARELLYEALSEDEAASFFNNCAISVAKKGQYEVAVDLYLSALTSLQTPRLKHLILYNAAVALFHLNRIEQVISILTEVKRLNPHYEKATRFLDALTANSRYSNFPPAH